MEEIGMFFIYTLTAVFLENAVFTRVLGVDRFMFSGKPLHLFAHGITLTCVILISSVLCYSINFFLYDFKVVSSYRALLYLLCISVVYVVMSLSWRYFMRERHPAVLKILPISAFNCAVLGTLVLSVSTQHSMVATVGFSFGTGIGYTIALFLIYTGRRRLELIELPRSFRGMPILLLYIGIVSLAIYGLIGHQLPT